MNLFKLILTSFFKMLQIIISAKYVVTKNSFCNRALDKGKFSFNVFFIFTCDKLFFLVVNNSEPRDSITFENGESQEKHASRTHRKATIIFYHWLTKG